MDLRDYIMLLARRWRIVAAVLLLGAVVGYLGGHAETPQYKATATLFVPPPPAASGSRAPSYAAIAASPQVTAPVVHELGLPLTPGQLARRISADAPPGTALVRISADDPVPAAATRIANAVAQRLAVIVERLDRPAGGGSAPVRPTVAIPASVPSAPHLPTLLLDLTIGLLAGLVAGLVLALFMDGADSVLRTADALAVELDLIGGPPLLGTIPKDGRVARRSVAVLADPHGPRAEGYRRVRTNLRFVPSDRGAKVLAVTSALPGEGKTSTAVNLAAALAETGARVCLVDADLRRARVADTLGLTRSAGLSTALLGQAGLDDVLQHLDTFTVLASGPLPSNPTELLGTEAMRRTLLDLAERFDHVLVDTAPLLPVADATVLAPAVDGYLLVVRAHRTTRRELARSVRALQHTGTALTGTVLNGSSGRGDAGSYRCRRPTLARVPAPRRYRPVLQLLARPCGPTPHAIAPFPTTESALP
ncbi:hypothetical protein DN069_09535 [Streptacidiphilus pinicola]|uniref:non-specific protein-tyrosine kinase n=1 Tax=Streptacidiphilus pinicola TaxID=2219663 RepID=A0A2X0IQB3_9ACTN|nr:polysaccharide biosynthesis tyrosine autokinase [Streptacidiphilus pinicola]RAG85743.1 hypothetical protein DN069_09535 [Streptacidiphilus pinicola]